MSDVQRRFVQGDVAAPCLMIEVVYSL